MKILLCAINTKYIHSNPAIYLMKAYAEPFLKDEDADVQIRTMEFTINHFPEDILAGIYSEKPDVILFSCYIWNWKMVRGLFSDIKKILPETDIWVGGPEVSFDPEEVLSAFTELRGVLVGEGEATFRDLLIGHYISGREAEQIAGLCVRYDSDGGSIRTASRPLLSMDEIPFIYNDGNIGDFEHKILYYETSRGCPFSCSYCLSSVDKTVRFRSLERVYRELQFFLDHKVPQVKFVDRTFNVSKDHSVGILRYLSEHDNGITNFHFEIAGDILTEEELEIMTGMRPGLIQLEIGVQTVNQKTIRAIHRIMDLEKLKKTVARINAMHNIHQHLDLIAGLPYEDYESFAGSFDAVYRMKPSQLQLGFLKVLKGSPMESSAGEFGIVYKTDPVYEVLKTNWISYDDILRLKRIEEMVEIYYNSHQFSQTIKVLELWFDSAFRMYEALAEFFKKKGYYNASPSRVYRYHIILDFVRSLYDEDDSVNNTHCSRVPGNVSQAEDLFCELLTYDMYLRENCKSRPEFSAGLSGWKEVFRGLPADRSEHIDAFYYNVMADSPQDIIKRDDKVSFVVFDYSHRDALYHNAAVRLIPSC